MIICGVDPGASGAIGVIRVEGEGSVDVYPMPWVPKVGVQLDQFRDIVHGASIVYIERLFGLHGQSAHAAVTMGTEYGRILGCLETLRIAVERVHPTTWKAALGLTIRGAEKAEKKAAAVRMAQGLFPGVSLYPTERCKKPSDGLAEALLIAEYARRQLAGGR